jgi:heme-NO-binding protein
MQGLIFVTWEKFLAERFGPSLLNSYRGAIGETAATAPLATHVYDDETLLLGVQMASRLTGLSTNMLLREYGRFFMLNALTSHLCSYLLSRVKSGRELLLVMRDAHAQMRRTPDALTPPIFGYEALSTNANDFALLYDSSRKLCPVLYGAVEGAAERYNEQVTIIERTCMRRGAAMCRFEIAFRPRQLRQPPQLETREQRQHRQQKQKLADMVLAILPAKEGITLLELQKVLQGSYFGIPLRPSTLLEALQHLQFVGLAASTPMRPGQDMMTRRYWRAPTS